MQTNLLFSFLPFVITIGFYVFFRGFFFPPGGGGMPQWAQWLGEVLPTHPFLSRIVGAGVMLKSCRFEAVFQSER